MNERVVPLALLAAWLVNDAEEWFAMGPWSVKHADQVRKLPVHLPWPDEGMSDRQAHLAIGMVGVGVLAATAAGVATAGKSSFYRSASLAFGSHSLAHIGQSLIFRDYTPGVFTGACVVLPYWVWMEARRKRSSRPRYSRGEKLGAAALLASLPLIVAAALPLSRLRTQPGRQKKAES